jgi:hypothetical protein
MITILNRKLISGDYKHSLSVTYPRTVNIIFGNYPYPEKIHNLIMEIRSNLKDSLHNHTYVKGGMTDWNYFLNHPLFNEFMTTIINQHQLSHPDMFQYFFDKMMMIDAWGNEIKTGDKVDYHQHNTYHGILYLSEGNDLILPDLNISITPKPGDYYIFPPYISHGVAENKLIKNRYSLIFNFDYDSPKAFKFNNKVEKLRKNEQR